MMYKLYLKLGRKHLFVFVFGFPSTYVYKIINKKKIYTQT